MRIIAHRGASGSAPENTLAAINRAWEIGADGVEVDVHLTKDHVPVVIHDSDTKRVAGRKLIIKQTTYAELCELDVGSWKGPEFAGERIPRLDEVLASMPARKNFFVEIKDVSGNDLARALEPIFRDNPQFVTERQVFLMSFYPDALWPMAARFPDLTLLLLVDKLNRIPRQLPDKLPHDSLPVHGLGFSHKLKLDDERREKLLSAGAIMNVWTVNEPSEREKWEAAGFDFLTTDVPELFIRQHSAKG
ncbi:glycerophosphodiester phosphodiesterase [Cerasicoccus maritimus]|uniref:glycerophosphodiester phosphodiesterase n=1 Tax=Cerasicoccus maritimus TaxID=490089 RepID=UPI002852BF2D|nr:glycerophosphodiester phosphodiesterase family protein [Cerasicoccus maritimus]